MFVGMIFFKVVIMFKFMGKGEKVENCNLLKEEN